MVLPRTAASAAALVIKMPVPWVIAIRSWRGAQGYEIEARAGHRGIAR
jgi:hypothetical protein